MQYLYDMARHLPAGALRWVGELQRRLPRLHRAIRNRLPEGPVRISHGVARGLLIEASRSNNIGYTLGTTEPLVQDFLQRNVRPGDVVLDVGANVGFFTLIAARLVGSEGRVYAFEPLPSNVETLRRNVELNALANVEIIEAAVGAVEGRARLALGRSSLDGRLIADDQSAEESVEVRVVSLDGVGLRDPARVVKIDVEGAEWDVLKGMKDLLRTRPIILCEVHSDGAPTDQLAAVADALGPLADEYRLEFLEDALAAEEWWAPHVAAMPTSPER
jgi:FkbM family methyltransferase